MLSNGFENDLVLFFKLFFLVNFVLQLHLFDLGFQCISWLWKAWYVEPPCFSKKIIS